MSLSEFRDRAARRQVRAYLDFFAPVTAQFLPDLADRLATPQGPALDLGCGDGELARSLRARGWQVIAVDRSPEMARTAHAASGADVVVADATALPVRGAALGALGAAFVLPHLPDLSRGLAEARRVLRPGGCLAMTGWAAPSLSPLTGLLADLVLAHTSEAAALIEAQRRSDGDYLRQALGAAGFADITVETLAGSAMLPSALHWWTGLLTATFGLGRTVQALPLPAQHAVRDRFLAAAQEFAVGEVGLFVPVAAVLVCARRI